MELPLIRDLGIALGLGLLVGVQREWADSKVAGVRTFPLITLLGALCSILERETGAAWVTAAGLIALSVMLWIGNRMRLAQKEPEPGLTTEIAGLTMYIVGALVVRGYGGVGIVTAGIVAVLLHWKQPLHAFVNRIGEADFRALVRLVIIGMVILPVLPDRAYGPYDVLNPYRIWLMVVLIVGISMAAYVARRLLGARAGTLLGGVLGGLISSTATTVGYARRSRARKAEAAVSAIVIMIASTVVFGRVLVEIAVVAPAQLQHLAAPLAAMMAFMIAVCTTAFFVSGIAFDESDQEQEPPSDLAAAVFFGLLYAAVLFSVAAVQEHFGARATYIVAALSGLTDMDAITLSSAQLVKAGSIEASTGWRLILVGAMANLVFKAGAVAALGTPRLLLRVAGLFGISLVGGIALLLLWPG